MAGNFLVVFESLRPQRKFTLFQSSIASGTILMLQTIDNKYFTSNFLCVWKIDTRGANHPIYGFASDRALRFEFDGLELPKAESEK